MRKLLFVGLFPVPALGAWLWLLLTALLIGALNLALLAEVWPHTPTAKVPCWPWSGC